MKTIKGMYTQEELFSMKGTITFNRRFDHAIRRLRNTVNYYYKHSDGSWTNYDCKTI